jgi:hypothetical protein
MRIGYADKHQYVKHLRDATRHLEVFLIEYYRILTKFRRILLT